MDTSLEWNYTELAKHYDKRAAYSQDGLQKLFKTLKIPANSKVVDIGAGTGKLTIPLAQFGYNVVAVEPNNEMRKIGQSNSNNLDVRWIGAPAESTGLKDHIFKMATFGSSFNVIDHVKTLPELARILLPNSWLVCMWNHRNLENPIQKDVESIIKNKISNYNYGMRRQDPSKLMLQNGYFEDVKYLEGHFEVEIKVDDYVDAWRSHATLQRQARQDFDDVITAIEKLLSENESIQVPYTTRIWYTSRVV